MSAASKGPPGGSGPDSPTHAAPDKATPDRTEVDFSTDVGLARTMASTGELVMSAQLPSEGSLVGPRPGSIGPSIPGLSSGASGSSVGLSLAPLPAPGSTDLTPGTMVGEYRVEGKLGEGGMGTVFAAIHPLIGKHAAIKVIKLELCANAEAVERFVQEARAVNQIGHPNIVDVFAFGTLPDGRRYLVMEWLKGESLAARLKRDKLSVEEVCDILDPVCRALEGAHEKRIIHRDLKPDNVFLVAQKGERPIVKLLDFGIAKLVGTEDTRLERTRTGSMLGTPAYISPEQARGRGVDGRTDIYALGAMAFEMFTGRALFVADNAMDMISSHLHDPPPAPCTVAPGLPPALDTLLLGMLEKEAALRPSLERVRETLKDLRRAPVATNPTVRAEPPSVDRSAVPGAPSARTAPGPAVTEPLPAGANDTASLRSTASTRARAGKGMWIAIGLAAVVAAGAAIALVPRGDGEGGATAAGQGEGKSRGDLLLATPSDAHHHAETKKEAAAALAPVVAPPPVAAASAKPGTVTVVVNVPGATVAVGGQSVKATKGRAVVSLPPGEHELVVSAPGRKTISKKIALTEGGTVDEKIRLERSASGAGKVPPAGDGKGPVPVTKDPGTKDPGTKDPGNGKKPPGDDDTVW